MSAPAAGDPDDDSGPANADPDDEREWQVTLEDLEDDDQPEQSAIEPGSPSVENTVFVVLGVLLTLYVLFGGL